MSAKANKAARAARAILTAPTRALTGAGGLVGQMIGSLAGGIAAGYTGRQWGSVGIYNDAARRDATTADWRASLSSADQAILYELDTMVARSRMMIANDGYAASAQGAYGRYVVGGGITARSAARHPDTGEMLKSFNASLDAIWNEYCLDPRLCDAEETKTLAEKQRLWMNELFAAGGVFIVENYVPTADGLGLKLQEVEYEQRDALIATYDGRAVRGGVEVGPQNQPLAYHLYTAAHPLEEYASKSQRVAAERCNHLYRQDRVRQRLGTPWMRPVMPRVRQLAMYESYTMLQARTRAAYPGFIEQSGPAPAQLPSAVAKALGAQPPATTTSEDDGVVRLNLTPGVFPVLKPGMKPNFPTPATPDTMYPPFVAEHLKGIAAGTGLDLATVVRWYADGNFSSQRQAKLDIWAEIDWIQDLLFIQKALRNIRRRFVELAIREGRLSATGFYEQARWRAAYLTTNWQGPPKYSIDEIKDQAAWDMRFRSLRGSPQEYYNEQGKDVRDVLAEWQEFRHLAEEYGLADVVDKFMGTGAANRPKAGMRPDGSGDGNGGNDNGDGNGGLAGLYASQAILKALMDDGGNGSSHRGHLAGAAAGGGR